MSATNSAPNSQQIRTALLGMAAVLTFEVLFHFAWRPNRAELGLHFTNLVSIVPLAVTAILSLCLRGELFARSTPTSRLSVLLAAAIATCAGLELLYTRPIWSEEIYWIEQAKLIVAGRGRPLFAPMNDFPSSFSIWPVALAYYVTGDPLLSMRLPGIIYCLAASYMCARLAESISRSKWPAPGYFLCFLSCALIVFAASGWSQININPMLVSGMLYFYQRAAVCRSDRAVAALALFCGLGVWTLYSPLIFAAACACVFLLSAVSPSRKALFVLAVLAFVVPLVSHVVADNGHLTHRHRGNYSACMEEAKGCVKNVAAHLPRYLTGLLPIGLFENRVVKETILEHSSVVLLVVGTIFCLVRARTWRLSGLSAICALSVFGLFSATWWTPWRELPLLCIVLTVVALGAISLVELIPPERRGARAGVSILLVSLHLSIFALQFAKLVRFDWGVGSVPAAKRARMSIAAAAMNDVVRGYLGNGYEVLVCGGKEWIPRVLRVLQPEGAPIRRLKGDPATLVESKAVVFIVFPLADCPTPPTQIEESLKGAGVSYRHAVLRSVRSGKREWIPEVFEVPRVQGTNLIWE